MREGDTILIADMCLSGSAIAEYITYNTYNSKNLPDDAGIKVSDSGRTFKVSKLITSVVYVCGT